MITPWPVNGECRTQPGVRFLGPQAPDPDRLPAACRPGFETQVARLDTEQRREEAEDGAVGGAGCGRCRDTQT